MTEMAALVDTRDCKVTIPALLFAPEFYPFDFVAKSGLTRFLVVEERILDLSPFIDIRFEPLSQAQFWVNTRELFALEGQHDIRRPQPVFIFHHAFVCSTLLARCLNQVQYFFSLKEPWLLRRMADHKRANPQVVGSTAWQETFCRYVMLLCRNFHSGKVPLIKVTNVANNLLAEVLRFLPGSKSLYLYSDLQSFLVSNLKKERDTQQKIPGLARDFIGDAGFARRHPQWCDVAGLSFLQVCALTWLVNLFNFRQCVEEFGSSQVRTLDARLLLQDMPATLAALSHYYGHAPGPADIQRMLDPQVTRTNAKDQSRAYGQEQKQRESQQIRERHAQELEQAAAWIAPLEKELGLLEFMHRHRLSQ
jgi:hypothetical protein